MSVLRGSDNKCLGAWRLADRLLIDLSTDGLVTVNIWPEGGLLETASQRPLVWPLDDGALEDLRWYLEDYLRAPFGVWEDRGPRVQAQLAEWGEAVFASVFGSGPERDAYQQARNRELQLVFRSNSPQLLGLPWELMRDPAGPVALGLGGVSRALPVEDLARTVPVPDGRLRVLMVISRPSGTKDVGYRMIARPLLERLDAVRGEVDLVVLRPPTLEALRAELVAASAAGTPYQVLHFDGHGMFFGLKTADGGEGVLVFERHEGGPHYVPAGVIAQVLAASGVPVVVLNACQSGAVGKMLEAAIATRLLGEGIASVVAMAYSVYAVAAAEFMATFYESLFAGGTVAAAVAAGRQQLFRKPGRPSPKGEVPLADWMVPVHYSRREVSFPQAVVSRPPELRSLADAPIELSAQASETGYADLDAVDGVFVGRDALFLELEAGTRLQKVVVLHGPAGTGKTELAKAFGRWYRDTGGTDRPEWVLWHSFVSGIASFGLDGVITDAGLQVFGSDFARLGPAERRYVMERLLAEQRLLLIWDNFETVRSMPDPAGATAPLDDTECGEIKAFLARLEGGPSAVIITSRTAEGWLGPVSRVPVGGLALEEAAQYAGELLAPYPAAAPRRAQRAFGELLEWLAGHPLSMRLILPLLYDTEPAALLEGLRGTIPLPGSDESTDGDRTTSLAASITYSFAHLSRETKRLLPAACLFHGVVDAGVLAVFSIEACVPRRFRGVSGQDWMQALDDAARVGLLTPLRPGVYQMPPALPTFLAARWRAEDPSGHASARDAATRALVGGCAGLASWLREQFTSGDAETAYAVIALQRGTLGSMLDYALDHQMWGEALSIAVPLDSYWSAGGLDREADAWTDRVILAIENPDGSPPLLTTPAGVLWLFITGAQGNRRQQAMQLEDAERIHRKILGMLQAQPASPERQSHIAHAFHNLGVVAHVRGRLEEAEDWYRKSLTIAEALGDRPGIAISYHQLGRVAQDRGRLEEAGDWYRKSLTITEALGDRPGMADGYHELGILAQDQGRLEEAGDWYRKSLTITEPLGDQPHMAASYHQLGTIAHMDGRSDKAENWYRKSLSVFEALGDRPHMAASYHNLGMLAESGGHPHQALEWIIRRVALFGEFQHPLTVPGREDLARLTARLGIDALEGSWLEVTSSPLPQAVRDYISSARPGPSKQQ